MLRLEKLLNLRWGALAIALLVSAPLVFWNAVRYSLPIGYAGMYTLMSEQIAQNGFQLPMQVPFYGPGGIPFAYPPLGLYLFALAIKLTGATFTYLRFMPAVFSLLALVPLFLLTNELTDSILAAAVAVLLASAASNLNISHIWAGGVVRAPAFGLSLVSIFFFVRVVKKFKWRDVILAGLFFGATVLTHLTYALFTAVWIAVWTLLNPRLKSWISAALVAVIGTFVAMPWVGIILARYGWGVFTGALDSHGSVGIVSNGTKVTSILPHIIGNLVNAFHDPLFAFLVGLGILVLLVKKKLNLVIVLFAMALFLGEAERFLATIGSILGGIGLTGTVELFHTKLKKLDRYMDILVSTLVVLVLSTFIWLDGLAAVRIFSPQIKASTFEMTRYLRPYSPVKATYLALLPQDEAEWLPYLMRRQPVIAQWGSEWLGNYDQQTKLMLQARSCQKSQDLVCVENFIESLGQSPYYLISLRTDRRLMDALTAEGGWKLIYQNDRYLVWSYLIKSGS
jgi:hypothetical protein